MANLDTIALRARYVFPVSAPPIAGGMVSLRAGKIVAVGKNKPSGEPVRDLGNVAILPGLVNAHTHLEFSDLAAPLGRSGQSLPDWIRSVIQFRRANAHEKSDATRRGLAECRSHQTALLGEIASSPWQPDDYRDAPLVVTAFLEVIGLKSDAVATAHEQLRRQLAAALANSAGQCRPPQSLDYAISPHAPYSVHPELLQLLVAAAGEYALPVAMHLAESREELELLRTGQGPFRTLLEDLGAWDATAIPLGSRPLDYLQTLANAGTGRLRLPVPPAAWPAASNAGWHWPAQSASAGPGFGPRTLVIHGNYLADDEIAFVAQQAERMSVVYCPRTHAYFGHETYPLAKLLAAGVPVALGTDSRASNPDLNLFDEMRHAARHHPRVSPRTILEMGTLAGARALGRDDRFGSLEVGKSAAVAIVPLAEHAAADPHELLFAESARDRLPISP